MGKQLGFYFNSSVCTGCKACQVACKDKNNNPIGVNFRRVVQYTGGSWAQHPVYRDIWVPNIYAYSVSTACMHCASPICVEVCPSGAMTKSVDGIVSVNEDYCLGCRLCQQACPYSAPQFNPVKGVMTKCNLCADLIGQGEQPACIAACPQRALEYGELSTLQAKYGTVNAVEPLPVATLTSPAIVITPHRNAVASGTGTGQVKAEV